jgi:hypothetical protein
VSLTNAPRLHRRILTGVTEIDQQTIQRCGGRSCFRPPGRIIYDR